MEVCIVFLLSKTVGGYIGHSVQPSLLHIHFPIPIHPLTEIAKQGKRRNASPRALLSMFGSLNLTVGICVYVLRCPRRWRQ